VTVTPVGEDVAMTMLQLPFETGEHIDDVGSSEPWQIEVVRSKRRKRTVGAQLVGGVLRVSVPSWMSRDEVDRWVAEMDRRYRRKHAADGIDLGARATRLARRYGLQRPHDIRWGGDMRSRWGSCTPATGTVRLSTHLARFPDWVLDYVIVHELAHLDVLHHSPAFWQIVHRYERAERAIGYLIAKSGDDGSDGI
jgi:predicted metal-dependent hydrolase